MLNGLFEGDGEGLARAMLKRKSQYRCSTYKNPQTIIREAYLFEPRLVAIVSGIKMQTLSSGMSNIVIFFISYRPEAPVNPDDICVDDGSWSPSASLFIKNDYPQPFTLISKDPDTLPGRFGDCLEFIDKYPGYISAAANSVRLDSFPEFSYTMVSFQLCLKEAEYVKLQDLAYSKAKRIIDTLLGESDSAIPYVMKAFLAFSYLQQTVEYDDVAASASDARISHPHSVMPYGPLIENKGICAGIAAAYKVMMDIYSIRCHIITGDLKGNDGLWGPHAWNLIQIGSHWYHVDATVYISKNEEVYTPSFMRTDRMFSHDHRWDTSKYPECKSSLMGYAKIEELIESNSGTYGHVESRFLNPVTIE